MGGPGPNGRFHREICQTLVLKRWMQVHVLHVIAVRAASGKVGSAACWVDLGRWTAGKASPGPRVP